MRYPADRFERDCGKRSAEGAKNSQAKVSDRDGTPKSAFGTPKVQPARQGISQAYNGGASPSPGEASLSAFNNK